MKLQIKDRKRIQLERYFPSIATEGPAASIVRGISANLDCSKIMNDNGRTEVVYCFKVRQRRFLQGEHEKTYRAS